MALPEVVTREQWLEARSPRRVTLTNLAYPTSGPPRLVRGPHIGVEPLASRQAQAVGQR